MRIERGEKMISFRKFWEYLDEHKVTQYKLINEKDIPESTLAKLRKNGNIETITIGKLCDALECQPGDIMENLPPEEVKPKEKKR